MSEAASADLAPEEVIAPDVEGAQPAEVDASGDADEAVEAEALAMGWKPQSSYKGPADKFVTAAEYVERGKTIMPFLRKELVRRDKEIEGLKKAVATSIQHISRADQRAYTRAKAELEAELAQYAEAGDKVNVKAVTDDLIALEKDKLQAPAAQADDEPDWFVAWKADNDWFGKDEAMSAATAAIANAAERDGYTGKAMAGEVDKRLREKFPSFFAKAENPNRRQPAAVEGGGTAARRTGKTYSDLSPEAKAMCDSFVRDIKGFTREKFVKDYDWS
jgi:hypothetical protein